MESGCFNVSQFACGLAFQKGKNGLPDQIEIQGNYKDELPEFIASKFGVSAYKPAIPAARIAAQLIVVFTHACFIPRS